MIKKNYFIIPAITILVAALSGFFSHAGMHWYDTALRLPWFVPPKWVFSTVWPLLYVFAALAAVLLWNQSIKTMAVRYLQVALCVVAALQILWCYTFFYTHNIAGGFYITVALVALLWSMVAVSYASSMRIISFLLLPQALWLSFALLMNMMIWLIN